MTGAHRWKASSAVLASSAEQDPGDGAQRQPVHFVGIRSTVCASAVRQRSTRVSASVVTAAA